MRQLLEFPHSHFCEKARWALDHKGLEYQRKSLFPGHHVRVLRRIAKASTVPVLLDGAEVVQGSSAILTYLDERYPDAALTPPGQAEALLHWEAEIDRDAGEAIRRVLYHHLLSDREQVSFCFMHRSPLWERVLFHLMYPLVSRRIRGKYRIDDASADASSKVLDGLLDRLDRQLAGKRYFWGDSFSRADVTVASLLSFLCLPKEHPVPWPEVRHPAVVAFMAKHAARPTTRWVERIYREHRRARP